MNSIDIIIPTKDGGELLVECVDLWEKQQIPEGWYTTIYIVDDGSTDNACQTIETKEYKNLVIIKHDENKGRSTACNTGYTYGNGDYVGFFDADCRPNTLNVIQEFINQLLTNVDVCFGEITSDGNDFWSKYFSNVSKERKQSFTKGNFLAFSTQCVIIKRSLFNAAGKFNANYKHYGFEDRDLIIRLLKSGGNFGYCPSASVSHKDDLNIFTVCEKMYTAGRETSGIFQTDHPNYYQNMIYFSLDTRHHGQWLTTTARLLRPIKKSLLWGANHIINAPLPYKIKSITTKLMMELFYMVGTLDAQEAVKNTF